MELVARKADLVRELQFFQQIVERKNTIPILANVLLEGTANEVTLLATDLEVALRSRCEAAVNKPGSVTLPAKKFYEVVRALPEGDVNIETDHQEFRAWRWVAPDQLESLIVPFKKELYRNVVAEFAPHF